MTGTPPWLLPACAATLAALVVGGSAVTARQVQADLRARGCTALADAGLPGVAVVWSGRDARVASDGDLGRLTSSVAVLSRLHGTRSVTVDTDAVAVTGTCPASAASAPAAGAAPSPSGPAPADDVASRTVSVKFATGSADLDATARAQLDALLVWLRDHPAAALHVRGHTDNTGFDTTNVPLSFRRAGNVADYLLAEGANAGSVDFRGFSSFEPVVPNVSPENRAQNRRADVVVEGSR